MKKMKSPSSSLYVLLLIPCLYIITSRVTTESHASITIDPYRGISPEDVKYYKSLSGDVIKCKNGSNKFSKAQLNDDFCDCLDGSDEPGTSACPGGKFYCRNAGHVPLSIYSSRVNDGICDCCDGSDEYNGGVKCPNTCWEAGKMARDKLQKKIATYQEGVSLRQQEVAKAKLSIAKDEAELLKLKSEEKILKGLVQQLKERKELIEKAEEEERLKNEKEKAKLEEEEKKDTDKADVEAEHPIDSLHDDKIGTVDDAPTDQEVEEDYGDTEAKVEHEDAYKSEEPVVEIPEKEHDVEDDKVTIVADKTDLSGGVSEASSDRYKKQEDDEIGSNKLSKEELGRLVASRWTGENTATQTEEVRDEKNQDHKGDEDTTKDEHDDEHDGYASDSDDDNLKYDDNDVEDPLEDDLEDDHEESSSYTSSSYDESDFSDTETSSGSSWLEKIQQTVRHIIDSVNVFKAPVNISDAAHVRKEYDDSSSKLSKIESRISSLTRKLKHDFGPDKEFYSFYDRCFETKQNKYVYKVCPFKQASQTEGHSNTRLGEWEKFEDSYRTMLFSNGEKCWNGPDRSLKVKLRCGLSNEVADVDEPSRCEYVALLSTPTLCLEDKLKELQEKLELMNKEQPLGHDEL